MASGNLNALEQLPEKRPAPQGSLSDYRKITYHEELLDSARFHDHEQQLTFTECNSQLNWSWKH